MTASFVTIITEILSDAHVRTRASYIRSYEYYQLRVRDKLQPHTPWIDFFNHQHQIYLILGLCFLYVIVTVRSGAHFIKEEHRLGLRQMILLFDVTNAIVSVFIFTVIIHYKIFENGMVICNPLIVDFYEQPVSNDAAERLSACFLLFVLQRYFEVVQSWWTRGRSSVSAIHVIFRCAVVVASGIVLPFDYNGDVYFAVLVYSAFNALLHCHYILATLNIPSPSPYFLPRFLFFCVVAVFSHSFLSYRIGPTCGSPDFVKVLLILLTATIALLKGLSLLKAVCDRFVSI